mmetsp:Transcript_37721/g.91780  ORF Transcript_37721/g.91780 Transcript_37721/m.91780 type:complete len:368 (-) Transcript_37721:109-1212(-)|eukprot:CAMPEP_0113513698 /NCGR_PEP_ID=MMETSP0014_2-20120614/40006_1 /TAXON_ID=2857 /ORGANISM="Nitzschia sp." /LENGTH=367 /DNA_ID=CAMNT_0000410129 /DNA_START=246 /DNA_END=1349 /DNA_ORIENTATION=+ /assembly_acc=CAM_ASM_000159
MPSSSSSSSASAHAHTFPTKSESFGRDEASVCADNEEDTAATNNERRKTPPALSGSGSTFPMKSESLGRDAPDLTFQGTAPTTSRPSVLGPTTASPTDNSTHSGQKRTAESLQLMPGPLPRRVCTQNSAPERKSLKEVKESVLKEAIKESRSVDWNEVTTTIMESACLPNLSGTDYSLPDSLYCIISSVMKANGWSGLSTKDGHYIHDMGQYLREYLSPNDDGTCPTTDDIKEILRQIGFNIDEKAGSSKIDVLTCGAESGDKECYLIKLKLPDIPGPQWICYLAKHKLLINTAADNQQTPLKILDEGIYALKRDVNELPPRVMHKLRKKIADQFFKSVLGGMAHEIESWFKISIDPTFPPRAAVDL